MAVPADPTVSSIVTQALKRAGRTSPTAAQITEATDHALQEVKADLMLTCPTHPLLLETATTVTAKGLQRYSIPSNLNEFESISLLDGPDTYRGTAQGGGTNSITLDSSFNITDADEIIGKFILITGGPGVEEYRQILDYSTGTKIATVELNWIQTPTSASTYLIVTDHIQLFPNDTDSDYDLIRKPTTLGAPYIAAVNSQEYLLYPVPDKSTYGLMARFWVDLSKLDETEPLFIQLLREWRSTWIQGVAVKTMQRFDEDRYMSELQVYKTMLDLLARQTCTVRQVRFYDA